MKPSTQDEVKGKVHEVKGRIKEKVGKAINNPNLENEGINEKSAGKVEKKIGQVEKSSGGLSGPASIGEGGRLTEVRSAPAWITVGSVLASPASAEDLLDELISFPKGSMSLCAVLERQAG